MGLFQFEPYDNSRSTQTIGELMLQAGRTRAAALETAAAAQARAAEIRGTAWAGAGQRIGADVSGTIGDYMRYQADAPRRQLLALQVNQATQAANDDAQFRHAMSLTAGGDLRPAVTYLQSQGAAGVAGLQKLTAMVKEQQDQHDEAAGAIGNRILAGGGTPDAVRSVLSDAVSRGDLKPEEAQSLHQMSIDHPDQIPAAAQALMARSASGRAALNKVTVAKPGEQGFAGVTNAPIAGMSVPEKPPAPSPASLATDAANPNSPTQAQSAAALQAIQAPTAAAQAETARHNASMEKISRMNAGREAAAQAETARHNRATELAANPFGTTLVGAPPTGASGTAPSGTPAPTATVGQTPAGGPTGQAVLDKLAPPLANQVKALAEGRMQFPAGFALRSPYWQNLIALVSQYDPTFDAINYNARSKTRNDFTSGKSAQTINALNTVAQHLDRLSASADALDNSWSPAYNSVANFVSRQMGSKVVTTFETDKKAVVDELTRAWRQAGGSEQDIKSWSAVLDASNSSTQLHGAIGEMGQLLEGKLGALENQFKQGMGSAADIPIVTPKTRATLSRLEQRAGGAAAPSTSTAAPAEGTQQPIPSIAGGIAEYRGGKWIRVK